MNVNMIRGAVAVLALAATAGLAAPAPGAAAPLEGRYAGSVDLGPVLLDGRYPLLLGDNAPGTIDVTTSAAGTLSAKVTFAATTEEAVGRISVRQSSIRLDLVGKTDAGRITVAATLQGGAFVGTAKLGKVSTPCRIPVAGVGPLRARIDVTVATARSGAVTGTGTLTVGRETVPVTARGRLRKDLVSLTVSGKQVLLKFDRGLPGQGSVAAAKWKAKFFGAAVSPARPILLVRE